VVLRLLDRSRSLLPLGQMGLGDQEHDRLRHLIGSPYGLFIVSGPTGAGKTTTLYAALNALDRTTRNITTIEDPVEYHFENINQIQINRLAGMTFANGLRAILWQDPDVVLIGEIRDVETAQIAVQSALTGHMVLSTVHTNDAPSTVNRLLDMGVEDYLLTSTVVGILAQRLVRTLCSQCKERYTALPEIVAQMNLARYTQERDITLWHAKGCSQCAQTGFIGRISILEMMPITDALRSLVMKHATATELRAEAIRGGMIPMYEDGMRKALAGVTTFEEVLRATRED
ncbi:MAG: GspE/PulE family protein, partial [Casimicrobiaceae bacterium]